VTMSTRVQKREVPKASVARRVAVSMAYAAAVYLVVWFAFRVLLSEQCVDGPVCSSTEIAIQAVLGVAMLIGWGGIGFLGWTGRLPGATGRGGRRASDTNGA
jgi:hypothetical protein